MSMTRKRRRSRHLKHRQSPHHGIETTPSQSTTPSQNVTDPGTRELARHHLTKIEPASKYRSRVRVLDGCSLDALLLAKMITLAQHDAGRRFGEDCLRARMLGVPGSNPNRSSLTPGSRISDTQCNALTKIGQALLRVTRDCGMVGEDILMAVIAGDRAPRRPHEFDLLREALSSLMDFYERWHGIRRRTLPRLQIRVMIAPSVPSGAATRRFAP